MIARTRGADPQPIQGRSGAWGAKPVRSQANETRHTEPTRTRAGFGRPRASARAMLSNGCLVHALAEVFDAFEKEVVLVDERLKVDAHGGALHAHQGVNEEI